MLHNIFENIYCINLDRRTDRWTHCLNQFQFHNIQNVTRVSAIDGSKIKTNSKLSLGNIGLIQTNIQILEQALSKGLDQILILEDDVVFTDLSNFETKYLQVPVDWSMLYFGGNHNLHMPNVSKPVTINDNVVRVHSTYTTHAVAIKREMYSVILDRLKLLKNPIDVEYSYLQRLYKCYCFYPAVATQLPGYSDINNQHEDYIWLIK